MGSESVPLCIGAVQDLLNMHISIVVNTIMEMFSIFLKSAKSSKQIMN